MNWGCPELIPSNLVRFVLQVGFQKEFSGKFLLQRRFG